MRGDLALARRFIRGVQPFIYGAADEKRLNFAAIETALEARDRIGARRRVAAAKSAGIDVSVPLGVLCAVLALSTLKIR